jgi:hypothetical protein
VADLTIEPAHLEEAFLEFYEGDDVDGNGTGHQSVEAGQRSGPS